MADGKWIDGLRADMAADEAARRVLTARLHVVGEYLPRALQQTEDSENVHHLRVGTRRADAALRIFEGCLPARDFKKARKRLRALRRAAGEARDWDVFALELAGRHRDHPAKEHAGLEHLFGFALGRRSVAQTHLEAAGEHEGLHFGAFAAEVVAAVRPPEDTTRPTLAHLGRTTLAGLRDDLARAAAADLNDYVMLHRVRIAGKRLRYAMEVFADCFCPPLKEDLYPRIEEVQEVLGRANDSHVAAGRLSAIRDRLKAAWPDQWERLRPGIEGLLRFHQRRLPLERRRFLTWWKHWQGDGAAVFDSLLV
jgi:CHAD domain-containing protein